MSYSDFTIDDLKQKLGLKRYLAKYKPLALSIDAPEKIMGILTKMCLGEQTLSEIRFDRPLPLYPSIKC